MDITDRLTELAHAVADNNWSEFSMRIPAEPDRDADLVLLRAAKEIDRLRAELAEAKRDAERLNFLEATQTGVYHVTERVRVPATTTDRRWVDEWRFVGWSAANRDDELPTVREAIDAAMAGGE